MKKICLIALFSLPLCALNLVKYDIYPSEQNESINITLSFDGEYKGKVDEKRSAKGVLLTLNGTHYAKEEFKSINSPLITGIFIRPNSKANKTDIMLEAKDDVRIDTHWRHGKQVLMIRALDKNAQPSSSTLSFRQEPQKNTFVGKFDYTSYILVMVLLLCLLLVLLWVSRSMKRGRNTKEFRVLFERVLDKQNKFVVLEFGSKQFLMILGASNILLDTIEKGISKKETRKMLNLGQKSVSANPASTLNSAPAPNPKNATAFSNDTQEGLNSRQMAKKTPKSFESFFEENKLKLQKLISKDKAAPKE